MFEEGLRNLAERLASSLARDSLVQKTVDDLRELLSVDRVFLYYFYRQWRGQVTFESLSDDSLSIFGMTGPDDCFNDEYAALYEAGRVRAIADIETEPIQPCHRDFLKSLQVKANLVLPILPNGKLWGLLIAHNCENTRIWTEFEIEAMQKAARSIANAPSIRDS
jgi:GAF domain-containing protein